MKFEIYRSTALFSKQKWRWRLRAGNNRIIATSGEAYTNFNDCLHAIRIIKASASDADIVGENFIPGG